ncbi:MAG: tetratricopeptide repeat protein [Sulfuricurvum sp.]|nr:tetratricopeptide repeat protein [Sulfuricurvum sp.]
MGINLGKIVILAALSTTMAWGEVVSDEARRYFDRGLAAVEMAKSVEDYQIAIDEFEKAIALAPEWGDLYYNLAMIQEKKQQYDEAMANFKKYLMLSPNAPDASAVKSMINKLEFRQEFQAKQQKLSGIWVESDGTPFSVTMEGNRIDLRTNRRNLSGDIDEYYGPGLGSMKVPTTAVETMAFHLERKGDALSGTWETKETQVEQCTVPKQGGNVEGTMYEKGGHMVLTLQRPKLKVFYASPFPLSFETKDSCREVTVIEQRNLTMGFDGPLSSGGIGAEVSTMYVPGLVFPEYGWTGHLSINSLARESEGNGAGLMVGDEILAIDGISVNAIKGNEAFRLLRGEVGSEIELRVKHKDAKESVLIRFKRVPVSTEFPKEPRQVWFN